MTNSTLMDFCVLLVSGGIVGGYVGMMVWLTVKMCRESKEDREEE